MSCEQGSKRGFARDLVHLSGQRTAAAGFTPGRREAFFYPAGVLNSRRERAMGLLSLFGKGPMSAAKIEKVAKLAANPFAQPDVRMREMQRLIGDGSPQALRGVLKRFAVNAQGHIADEDEKKWLEDRLADEGEAVLAPLADYIRTQDKLTYALRAYQRVAGQAQAVAFFLEVLVGYGPDDYRSGDAKLQLVYQLADHLDVPAVMPALLPFLHDHSDDVRWAVMDALETRARAGKLSSELQSEAAVELGQQVMRNDVGPRIQRRAAEVLADLEWQVPGEEQAVANLLDDAFFIDKKRYLRRRAKKRDS